MLLAGITGAGACAMCGALAGMSLLRPQNPEIRIITDTAPPASTPDTIARIPEPPIIPRSQWGARPPNHTAENENGFYSVDNPFGWFTYGDDVQRMYQTLIIHHSVIYDNDDVTTLKDAQDLHMDERLWADIGYHYLIGKNGGIYEGRDVRVRGVHVAGYNTGSMGVCLLGNFNVDQVSELQWQSLGWLCAWLVENFSFVRLAAHQDFNPQTECPGTNLLASMEQLANALGLARGIDAYSPHTPTPIAMTCPCCGCIA
jgi:hypothetical protein